MMKVVTEPDLQFGLKLNKKGEAEPVRIKFIVENSALTEDQMDPTLLVPITDPDLLRNADGSLKHPRRDVHWEFVEANTFKNTPREKMNKKIDRPAGKVGNFSVPYGGKASLLERKLEIDTGEKPPPGTGDAIIGTYTSRYPTAAAYLDSREMDPEYPGYFKSVSGARFMYHIYEQGDLTGLSEYARQSMINPLKREARNKPIQSLVADTLARAVVKLNKFFKQNNLKSRTIIPLYDACYTLSPIEERHVASEAHQYFMSDSNTWNIEGRTLKFEIETEFTTHWSTPLSDEDKKLFVDKTWRVGKFENLNWSV